MRKRVVETKKVQGYILATFTLRGVNTQEILNDYIKGNYFNKTCGKVVLSKHEINQNIVRTENPDEQSFYYTSNTAKQIIHTTGQDRYQIVLENGDPNIPFEFECLTCNKSFNQVPLGIPVRMEILSINYLLRYAFHINKPYFCCFEHVFETLIKITDNPNPDPIYKTSEEMLKLMYSIMYPNKELTFIKNKDIFKKNHGFIDDSSHSIYVKTPSLICLPVKEQYFEY